MGMALYIDLSVVSVYYGLSYIVCFHFSFLSCLFKIHRVRAEYRNGLQDALDKPIDILHIRITINILAGVIFTLLFLFLLSVPLSFSLSLFCRLSAVVVEVKCAHI